MQANWSLVLNILLLMGVMVGIARMMRERRKAKSVALESVPVNTKGGMDNKGFDDIIAVRKINVDELSVSKQEPGIRITSSQDAVIEARPRPSLSSAQSASPTQSKTVMMLLVAKDDRQLAGYELLQTVLAAGLRFGEGQLFHRHQNSNGQGPILCSLAAATPSGLFDLQNMGAFRVRGLCLFMQVSGNRDIDASRFDMMMDTARQLSEGLDAHWLDDARQPVSEASLRRYHQLLNIERTV
jgi:cell division protein ZipA